MSDSRTWMWLVIITLAGALLYLLAPVLTPFLVAALLAYMGNPIVNRLEQYHLSGTWAVVVVFTALSLLFLLLLLIFVPLLERQVVLLANKLPGYIDWVQHKWVPVVGSWLFGKLSCERVFLIQCDGVPGISGVMRCGGELHRGLSQLSW